ncbi:MAG: hypothetical protein EPGJADBJ_03867 [Saprospiraceae bacterium]|nr:hypothetical protein [Saprospiraceae bacterium]
MRFLADENFNNHIFRGLLLHKPDLDIVRVQDVGLSGKGDPEVLAWALAENRILLTHDAKTIPAFAFARLADGHAIPGIFIAPWDAYIGQVIMDLLLIIECSKQEEWEGQIHYLPL